MISFIRGGYKHVSKRAASWELVGMVEILVGSLWTRQKLNFAQSALRKRFQSIIWFMTWKLLACLVLEQNRQNGAMRWI